MFHHKTWSAGKTSLPPLTESCFRISYLNSLWNLTFIHHIDIIFELGKPPVYLFNTIWQIEFVLFCFLSVHLLRIDLFFSLLYKYFLQVILLSNIWIWAYIYNLEYKCRLKVKLLTSSFIPTKNWDCII